MTSHGLLKRILVELGENSERYVTSKSGDSEPLDIRLGKRHITYQPDIYWVGHKSEVVIFEIPYTEQSREIVGEICLASLAKNVVKFFAVFDDEEKARVVKSFITIPDEQIRDENGDYRLKYKAGIICVPEDFGDDERKVSRFLRRKLKSWI